MIIRIHLDATPDTAIAVVEAIEGVLGLLPTNSVVTVEDDEE